MPGKDVAKIVIDPAWAAAPAEAKKRLYRECDKKHEKNFRRLTGWFGPFYNRRRLLEWCGFDDRYVDVTGEYLRCRVHKTKVKI